MAFLVYKKQNGMLIATGEKFSLAGYNLIYRLWEKRGKPTEQGWHVSANDLIKQNTKITYRFSSDFIQGPARDYFRQYF